MEWSFLFFFNSALLGVGLAMDAFSVSMANGLHDPRMSMKRMCIIAGTFGLFQAVMPMTGWVCVHTVVELFSSFETFIPWIALILLAYIGGKMLMEGSKGEETEEAAEYLGKGSHVNIVGRLRNNNYEKDGETVYGMAFTAEEIDYLDSRAEGEARRNGCPGAEGGATSTERPSTPAAGRKPRSARQSAHADA